MNNNSISLTAPCLHHHMGSLYTYGLARRLLCSACRKTQTSTVTATGRAGCPLICEAQRTRQYATIRLNPNARTANPQTPKSTAPSSSPASSRAPRSPANGSLSPSRQPARLLFSTQDIPLLQEWVISLEGLRNKNLTPLQCIDGARRYVSVATQHESEWQPKLETGMLSPFPVHLLDQGSRAVSYGFRCANMTSQNTISHRSCFTGSEFYLSPGTPRPDGVWGHICCGLRRSWVTCRPHCRSFAFSEVFRRTCSPKLQTPLCTAKRMRDSKKL